jgi:carbamoylphosphate synthase large subunit
LKQSQIVHLFGIQAEFDGSQQKQDKQNNNRRPQAVNQAPAARMVSYSIGMAAYYSPPFREREIFWQRIRLMHY